VLTLPLPRHVLSRVINLLSLPSPGLFIWCLGMGGQTWHVESQESGPWVQNSSFSLRSYPGQFTGDIRTRSLPLRLLQQAVTFLSLTRRSGLHFVGCSAVLVTLLPVDWLLCAGAGQGDQVASATLRRHSPPHSSVCIFHLHFALHSSLCLVWTCGCPRGHYHGALKVLLSSFQVLPLCLLDDVKGRRPSCSGVGRFTSMVFSL
jgi:hypothetical protein